MDMVRVTRCDASECAYNMGETCHAMAITIGGRIDRKCDTFMSSAAKGGIPDITAGVGACKVPNCTFNKNLECVAPSIQVGHRGDEVDCLTFTEA